MSYTVLAPRRRQGLGTGVSTPTADDQSDQALADQVGITVPFLRAIRKIESGGNPQSLRFEPNKFRDATAHRYDAQVPYTPSGTSGPSHVPSETNKAAFQRAYALDPTAAVAASSWGLYQEMGSTLLRIFGDPASAVAGFNADPSGVSERLLIEWMRARPAALAAARGLNFAEFARLYNGPGYAVQHYDQRLRAAYDSALTTWTGVSPGLPWVTIAIGGSVVAASAIFAFWAWRRSHRR